MKKSTEPTRYILVKAFTGSEWDTCDFAVVRISEQWRTTMRKRLELLTPFQDDLNFYSLHYWEWPEGFYLNDDEKAFTEDLLDEDEEWCFIQTDEAELANLTPPENRLDTGALVLTIDGYAYYKANGKHTNEEFWTSGFDVKKLLNP